MDGHGKVSRNRDEEGELRRGPWTVEEDLALIDYISHHGDGRWNSLASCAGLKRTGKSCRLRWLNYLRPEVRRGNITLEEQLLILELHSRWGNRWSKIAQHLPGRTDNEIKNYWRTRVQKHAKQLKCDVNSKQFKDTMRYLWMPRLVERIQSATGAGGGSAEAANSSSAFGENPPRYQNANILEMGSADLAAISLPPPPAGAVGGGVNMCTPESSSAAASSDSFGTDQVSQVSNMKESYEYALNDEGNYDQDYSTTNYPFCHGGEFDFHGVGHGHGWMDGGDVVDSLWNVDDLWFPLQNGNV